MNIRGGNKHRIDRKKKALKFELSKPEEEQNRFKIRRLKKSIERNKEISRKYAHRRKMKRLKLNGK